MSGFSSYLKEKIDVMITLEVVTKQADRYSVDKMSLQKYFRKKGNNGDFENVNLFENVGTKNSMDTECAVAFSPKRHKQQSAMAKNVKYDTTKRQKFSAALGLLLSLV